MASWNWLVGFQVLPSSSSSPYYLTGTRNAPFFSVSSACYQYDDMYCHNVWLVSSIIPKPSLRFWWWGMVLFARRAQFVVRKYPNLPRWILSWPWSLYKHWSIRSGLQNMLAFREDFCHHIISNGRIERQYFRPRKKPLPRASMAHRVVPLYLPVNLFQSIMSIVDDDVSFNFAFSIPCMS